MSAIGGHHSHTASSTVWLTPPGIISALGGFDLDPCAAPEPRPWPTADQHVAVPDDGLSVAWAGRVWLNPPYDEVGRWMKALADHGTGTALVFARTETAWFVEQVWLRATSVRFLHGRLRFHLPDGSAARGNAGGPSVLVAYGEFDDARLRCARLGGTYLPITSARKQFEEAAR